MSIKSCLILSAGYGTRMGSIGTVLPKVLWPLFERSMLDLQIERAKSLGCKDIIVNLHHQIDFVRNELQKKWKDDITIIEEKDLLGAGGTIQYIKSYCKQIDPYLLVVNCDVFYLFDDALLLKAKKMAESHTSVLFGVKIERGNYNGLEIKDGNLVGIDTSKGIKQNYSTYSGTCLVNLNKIADFSGPSSFFATIADYKKEKIPVIDPEISEYWDFGTDKIYFKNMFAILANLQCKDNKSIFLDFLLTNESVFLEKLKPHNFCYGKVQNSIHTINLSEENVINGVGAIYLNSRSIQKSRTPGIYFEQKYNLISI